MTSNEIKLNFDLEFVWSHHRIRMTMWLSNLWHVFWPGSSILPSILLLLMHGESANRAISWPLRALMADLLRRKKNENLWKSIFRPAFWKDHSIILQILVIMTMLQSRQVKRTPQDSINELIIWKMNPLVISVTSVKFKSVFLHA